MRRVRSRAMALAMALLLPACPRHGTPPATTAPPLRLSGGSEAIHLVQRHSVSFAGDDGDLVVSIGDITGGQTLLEATRNGYVLVHRAFRVGDTVRFDVDGFAYELTVSKLDNALIGDDVAEITLALVPPTASATPTERQRIEALIDWVATSGVVFIRNGDEHSAAQAAEHLRRKLGHASSDITLEQFIEEIGSRSSTTGRAYRVRLADGTEQDAGPWMRDARAE